MTTVSVIIAGFNARRYIERAVNSALDQTGLDVEVIVVDDVSTDGTPEFVTTTYAQDDRVRLIVNEKNIGPGFARNAAIAAAEGEWIAILDADDAFLPNRLNQLISLAKAEGADVVTDNLIMRDADTGQYLGPMFPTEWISEPRILAADEFVTRNMGDKENRRRAYGFMKPVINRQFLLVSEAKYRITKFSEDYIFALELLLSQAKWLIVPDALYEYDIRPNSLTVRVSFDDLDALINAEKSLLAEFKAGGGTGAAIRKHIKSVELARAWDRFMISLKDRNILRASKEFISSPEVSFHIIGGVFSHLKSKTLR